MSAIPLSFVPVCLGLALHIVGGAVPVSPHSVPNRTVDVQFAQSWCIPTTATDTHSIWRAQLPLRAARDRDDVLSRGGPVRPASPSRLEAPRLTACRDADAAAHASADPGAREIAAPRFGARPVGIDASPPAARAQAASDGPGERLAGTLIDAVRR